MKYALIFLALTLSSLSLSAEKKHRLIVEEIFEIQNVKLMQEQATQSLANQEKARLRELNLIPEAMKIHEEHIDKVIELVKSALSWDNIKEDYLKVFMEVYSEKEAKTLLKFYKTKVGKKSLDTQLFMMQEFGKINQIKQQEIQPQLSQMSLELERKLKEVTYGNKELVNSELKGTQGIVFNCRYEMSDYVSQEVCGNAAKYLRKVDNIIVEDSNSNDNGHATTISYQTGYPIFSLVLYTNNTNSAKDGKYLVGNLYISIPLVKASENYSDSPFKNLSGLGGSLIVSSRFINVVGTENTVGNFFLDYFKDVSLKLVSDYQDSHPSS